MKAKKKKGEFSQLPTTYCNFNNLDNINKKVCQECVFKFIEIGTWRHLFWQECPP